MGRGTRKSEAAGADRRLSGGGNEKPEGRPEDVSEALSQAESQNDFLGLDGYAQYGVLSEMISMHDSEKSAFTEEQYELACETIDKIGAVAQNRSQLGTAIFSDEGLRAAEGILREVADGGEGQMEISESMDPDREFLFQSDEDHCLAMAEFLSVLRTGKAGESSAEGMGDSWRERNADIADAARDAAKYENA